MGTQIRKVAPPTEALAKYFDSFKNKPAWGGGEGSTTAGAGAAMGQETVGSQDHQGKGV